MLTVCTAGSELGRVMVGATKKSLSVVDRDLIVDEVVKIFGQCVKFVVEEVSKQPENSTSVVVVVRNAFSVLMNSQRSQQQAQKLPSLKKEINN